MGKQDCELLKKKFAEFAEEIAIFCKDKCSDIDENEIKQYMEVVADNIIDYCER